MRCNILGFALAVASLSALTVPARGDVAVYGGGSSVGVNISVGTNSADHSIAITSLPTTTSDSVGPYSGSSDQTTYTMTGTDFNIGMSLASADLQYSSAMSDGVIYFEATDATTTYALYGSYNFSSSYAYFDSYLYDLSSGGQTVGDYYGDTTQNLAASSGTFSLAGTNAGDTGSSSGALSGLLKAGHEYELEYTAKIGADASANGTAGISFSDPADDVASTPLPTTAYAGFALLGGLGCWMLARRRKAAAD